jgi:hypothetical protein
VRNDARPMGQSQVASHQSPIGSAHSPVEPPESAVEPAAPPEKARDTSERKKPFVTDRDPGDEETI